MAEHILTWSGSAAVDAPGNTLMLDALRKMDWAATSVGSIE